MRSEVRQDYDWQDRRIPQAIEILRQNAMNLLSIGVASQGKDARQATDLVVTVDGGDVALRLRRPDCHYRDLTIRSYRSNGYKTELDKIKEGFARWYLYCWFDWEDNIGDYMLIDIDSLRASGLLDNRRTKMNRGGKTGFISISPTELVLAGCMIATNLSV